MTTAAEATTREELREIIWPTGHLHDPAGYEVGEWEDERLDALLDWLRTWIRLERGGIPPVQGYLEGLHIHRVSDERKSL